MVVIELRIGDEHERGIFWSGRRAGGWRGGGAAARGHAGPGVPGGDADPQKLMVLHTSFSLGLAAILLVAARPAIGEVVAR